MVLSHVPFFKLDELRIVEGNMLGGKKREVYLMSMGKALQVNYNDIAKTS